jgi:DNA-binding NtrC family response regulator
MRGSDPLDTSTLDAPSVRAAVARVPTVRVVFRPGAGIVDEPAVPLRSGVTLVGRMVRSPGLALRDDALVSREHARLHHAPGGALEIEDLASRNGVRVNGRPATRASLVDGDVVRMGASFLVVRFEDPREGDTSIPSLLGVSPELRALRVAVKRVGESDASVVVLGETGTGKEVVAEAIHAASGRRGPFVAVNCAAIPDTLAESHFFGHVAGAFTGARTDHAGVFAAADGGTLFLDEVGDMPLAIQPKLLRALETRTVTPVGAWTPRSFDARIVAATHVDLASAVQQDRFRGDLFARLAQLRLVVPALRDRREDILRLAARRLPSEAPPLAPDLVEALLVHDWPFNVRELFGVVAELSVWGAGAARLELSLVRDRLSRPASAPPRPTRESDAPARESPLHPPAAPTQPPDALDLEALLTKHGGNVAAVARETGRSRTQVYRWIAQLGLDPTRYRSA